jgi:hypothetical protein
VLRGYGIGIQWENVSYTQTPSIQHDVPIHAHSLWATLRPANFIIFYLKNHGKKSLEIAFFLCLKKISDKNLPTRKH